MENKDKSFTNSSLKEKFGMTYRLVSICVRVQKILPNHTVVDVVVETEKERG